MATSGPFDDQDYREDQWAADMAAGWVPSTVIDETGEDLALQPYVDGSGMNVKIRPGRATVGGMNYYESATVTLPIAAAPTSGTRTDLVALRRDLTAGSILPVITPGLRRDSTVYDMLLGSVAVPAGAVNLDPGPGSAGSVTDQRVIRPSANRQARGLVAFNTMPEDASGWVEAATVIDTLTVLVKRAFPSRRYKVTLHVPAIETDVSGTDAVVGLHYNTSLQYDDGITAGNPELPIGGRSNVVAITTGVGPHIDMTGFINGGLSGRTLIGVSLRSVSSGHKVRFRTGSTSDGFLMVEDIGATV